MKPLIKLENVWKTYQMGKVEVSALRGVNLEIKPNTFVTLMGPSGSGKSTLLYLIGCLDLPSRGKVFLDDHDISQLSEDELAQIRGKKIGFVFQQFNLLSNLSALENVILPMVFQKIDQREREKRGADLLTLVGLKERIKHRPTELSGGERQRIAIARALANDPSVIVADEPTGNLDSTTGKKIMEILVNLHKKYHKTIIVVTHDPNIAKYSREVIKLRDGCIVKNNFNGEVLWEG